MAALPQRVNTGYLIMHYLMFAVLGLAFSLILNCYYKSSSEEILKNAIQAPQLEYPLSEVKRIVERTDCEKFKAEAHLPESIAYFLSTKLRYQFEPDITDESSMLDCRAVKVYGLIRHGTRYPSKSHLKKWETMRESILERYSPNSNHDDLSDLIKDLLKWNDPLYQAVSNGTAEDSELTESGMKEEYCLGKRLTQRLPEIFKSASYPSSYAFRSTRIPRTINSALSYAVGIFEKTADVEMLALETLNKSNDPILRYFDIPCPAYDQKVIANKSFSDWIGSFLNTSLFQNLKKDIQQQFPDNMLFGNKDIFNFYTICIHELSILGSSRWCDLFSPDQLSVFEYNKDLKTYWVKGAGYPITGKRSVFLVQSVLDFLSNSNKSIALSFAHSETILPFLAFFNTFPVPNHLSPTNYEGLNDPELYVRLLVNEKPVKIGLCNGEMELCKLEVLKKNAFDATDGFSGLKKLCD